MNQNKFEVIFKLRLEKWVGTFYFTLTLEQKSVGNQN